MSELRFTVDHEWLRQDADGLVTVGITAYAQEALGDVVFVQLPEPQTYGEGDEVAVLESVKAASNIAMPLAGEIVEVNAEGDEVAVLESVKAASNIAMPLAGEIVEVNAELDGSPELVNEDPLGKGWFFRFRPTDAAAVAALLDQAGYDRLLKANDDA